MSHHHYYRSNNDTMAGTSSNPNALSYGSPLAYHRTQPEYHPPSTLPPLNGYDHDLASFVFNGDSQTNLSSEHVHINSISYRDNEGIPVRRDTIPQYPNLPTVHVPADISMSRVLPLPSRDDPVQGIDMPENSQFVSNTPESRRKPRLRQPSEVLWGQMKPAIHALYIEQKLPLPKVIEEMKQKHDFNASEKMYKDKFKEWHWSKNLPHKKAAWMVKRLHEHRPHKIVFQYGNQKWDEKRLMKISERIPMNGGASEIDAWSPSAPTPSDIQYSTVLSVTNGTPRELQDHHASPSEAPHYPDNGPLDFDSKPTSFDLRQVTLSDLRTTLESAAKAASNGMSTQAEEGFRDSLLGFRHILSPTHDETLRAGYHCASFYANLGRMEEADAVLHWMTSAHLEKWGSKHDKTLLHYVRVVDLLRSWNRTEQAEIIVYKLMDNTNDTGNMSDWMGFQAGDQAPPGVTGGPSGCFQHLSLPESGDPATISHQLKMIDLALAVNIAGPLVILPRIIEQCKSMPIELGAQHIKASCLLANSYLSQGRVDEAQQTLSTVRHKIADILEPSMRLPSKSSIDAARQLAFALFKANNESACNDVLNEIIGSIEINPIYDESDKRESLLLDCIWSFASEFNRMSTWEKCQPWVERGLGLAIKNGMGRSHDAKRFQDILVQRRFTFRSSEHIDDLMDFSKGLFRIRLV